MMKNSASTGLREADFVDLPIFPSGVYLLLSSGRIVYIGQSVNLFARISKHRSNLVKYREGKPILGHSVGERRVVIFDQVKVYFAPIKELDALEFELINRYQPAANIRLKRRRVTNIDLSKFGFEPDKWQPPVTKKNSQGLLRI